MKSLMFPLTLTMIAIAPAAAANSTDSTAVVGSWLTDSGSAVVDISFCEEASICGIISWVDPNGASVVDRHNPDESLRERPLVGVTMLSGFKAKGDKWKGGKIYNPKDGKTYKSKVSLNDDGTLKVKGCVGPICKTQIWTRSQP